MKEPTYKKIPVVVLGGVQIFIGLGIAGFHGAAMGVYFTIADIWLAGPWCGLLVSHGSHESRVK